MAKNVVKSQKNHVVWILISYKGLLGYYTEVKLKYINKVLWKFFKLYNN